MKRAESVRRRSLPGLPGHAASAARLPMSMLRRAFLLGEAGFGDVSPGKFSADVEILPAEGATEMNPEIVRRRAFPGLYGRPAPIPGLDAAEDPARLDGASAVRRGNS